MYQDLDDLKASCAELSPEGGPTDYEVGVFCGKYVTPVDEAYFQHLQDLRGKKRKFTTTQAQVASSGPTQHMTEASAAETVNGGLGPSMVREDISIHNVATEPERRL